MVADFTAMLLLTDQSKVSKQTSVYLKYNPKELMDQSRVLPAPPSFPDAFPSQFQQEPLSLKEINH
jgi:hypothetical protein